MTAAAIAHLRIKLDDVEPAVVRRLEVPLTIRLDRLHLVLQAAMGWTNCHLYEIRARDIRWGMPDPNFGDGPLDAAKARLVDVLEDVAAPGVTASSSMPSLIPAMKSTKKDCSGLAPNSIPLTRMPTLSFRQCTAWQRSGLASQLCANAPDPWSSPDGYLLRTDGAEDIG
jgi:Plasmid pRiA4b ORF-3-like protein